ncbi:MAG TPA: PLP-dependent transferase [Vicinamibacteria bacterium]|nr:PLP-dependent transferase [Vicinamibacteria bacterium]
MTQETESLLRSAPPVRGAMDPSTVALHEAVDENIRRSGRGYLRPEGESVAVDLLGSARMLKWQERKSAATFLGSFCWSELPQVYGRYGGESARDLVARVRALEEASAAVVTDSGMSAAALLLDSLLEPGDHAIVARSLYNKSKAYLAWLEKRMGIEVTLLSDVEWEAALEHVTERTRIVLVEIFTNPLMRAFDPEKLAAAAHEGRKRSPRLRLVVDDTIVTPWGVHTPLLAQGADFVIASGTKALDGRDRNLWGYVAANRIDELNACMDLLAMRGGILDEVRCRSVLSGLDGARRNFEDRCRGASEVARFLAGHAAVSEVFHPSLPDHPDRETVDRCFSQPGSLVSFRLSGADDEAARHFCDVLAMTGLVRYALSFDGLVSKVNHHRTVSEYFTAEAEVERLGVDRLVRFAMGIEAPADVIASLDWALRSYGRISDEEVAAWRRDRARSLGLTEEEE